MKLPQLNFLSFSRHSLSTATEIMYANTCYNDLKTDKNLTMLTSLNFTYIQCIVCCLQYNVTICTRCWHSIAGPTD